MLAKTRPRSDSDEVQRDAGEREKETAAAAGRKRGAGLGFWRRRGGFVGAGSMWGAGPRGGGRRATPLPFGEATVTKDRGGTGRSEREKRVSEGWAARALRG